MNIQKAIIAAGKNCGITIDDNSSDLILVPTDSFNCVKMYEKSTGDLISRRWNPYRLDLVREDWKPIKKEALVKGFHIDLKDSQD